MNATTLAIALALSASLAPLAHAESITTLQTVEVRPATEQLAQQQLELHSAIPTLAAMQVHPSSEQVAQHNAELAAQSSIVTLAAVQVRPDAELHQAIAAEVEADQRQQRYNVFAAMTDQLGQWSFTLPLVQSVNASLDLQTVTFEVVNSLVRP